MSDLNDRPTSAASLPVRPMIWHLSPKRGSRETFETSRELDFLSEKELTAQIGHPRPAWPLVLIKELVDNSLDACEESGIAPVINIAVDDTGITVTDNGPGIPPEVVAGVINFSIRVSSREAYVAPDRGAQGNALKTVVAMPFVAKGGSGQITINARGFRHELRASVDHIQQKPVIEHDQTPDEKVKNGTSVYVDLACSIANEDNEDFDDWDDTDLACSIPVAKSRFLQFAEDFTYLNPHLSLTLDWFGERLHDMEATNPSWKKWKPSQPTSPHWYELEHTQRLVGAYLAKNPLLLARDFLGIFDGLRGSAKRKAVLDATGLHRKPLAALISDNGKSLDAGKLSELLGAMKANTKPVKSARLGVIGKEHIAAKFAERGFDMATFEYRKVLSKEGLPLVIETAFAAHRDDVPRRIITGVNMSPGIINPFRELGTFGKSLDAILEEQRAGEDEPVALLLHLTCPRVQFADRGKSSVILEEM